MITEERMVVRLMLSKYGIIEERNLPLDLQHEPVAARQYGTSLINLKKQHSFEKH